MSSKGWIGVDLDGTLAHYTGWKGAEHIGDPVPLMVQRVKNWIAAGHEVKIFTARISVEDVTERTKIHMSIMRWSEIHIGQPLSVTNVKDFAMIELWDDRAVQVEANTGRPVGKSTRGLE
jgi:hypothetical protein